MSFQRDRSRFNNVIEAMANEIPVLLINNATKISPTAFRVVMHHAQTPRELTASDYKEMFSSVVDRQFAIVDESFCQVGEFKGNNVLSAIIEAQAAIEDFDDEKVRNSMKVISANVFMDKTDETIWRVIERDGKKQLVQSVGEDFDSIIKSRIARSNQQILCTANFMAPVVPANGDYVMFYDPTDYTTKFGYALTIAGDINVCERRTRKYIKIVPAQVIDAAIIDNKDKHSLIAKISTASDVLPTDNDFSPNMATSYLSYMNSLYHDTPFFAELEKLIANRRRLGSRNMPLTTFHE